jgi:hypothetical protein
MIAPTETDIGRKVVYRDPFGDGPQEGVISSLPKPDNSNYGKAVWVRFKGPTGEMTPLDRLEWIAS